MAHGQPDYGMYTLANTIYRLTDMGELAARLGSINTYDRRGDVIFLDSFESGLTAWSPSSACTGSDLVQSAKHARSGGFSAKFVCGSDGTRQAQLAKQYSNYTRCYNLGYG